MSEEMSNGVRIAFKIDIYIAGKELPDSYNSHMYFNPETMHLIETVEDMMDAIYEAYQEELNKREPRYLRIEHDNFTNTMIIKKSVVSLTVHSLSELPEGFNG